MSLAAELDALLPQTQCTRCGYSGCRPYADALAAGEAELNQCPPGGEPTILALAQRLGRAPRPLNPVNGREGPWQVAVIDESRCIGCARCLAPCPVDAIVGAQRFMHTVLAAHCTGCELCLPPCPVDCIQMRPAPDGHANHPDENRRRFEAHAQRYARRAAQRQQELGAKKAAARRPDVP